MSLRCGPSGLAHPLLVAAAGSPLVRYVAHPVRVDYRVAGDEVRFSVHERVAFVARVDTKAVELTGVE